VESLISDETTRWAATQIEPQPAAANLNEH